MLTLKDQTIPELMDAVVLEKPYSLSYKPIPVWPIDEFNDPDLLLIKVEACGICGSDFRYYQGENPWAQHTLGRHVDNPPNIVLGHEFSGVVFGIVSKSNKKWLGKRVIPICSKSCGECDFCRTGRENLCENTIHLGHGQGWGKLQYYPGAYADFALAWGGGCFEIPKETSFEEATTMDVLAVCLHAVNQINLNNDSVVLILGCGPVGNGIAQIIRLLYPDIKIFVIERSKKAIEIAKTVRINLIIDSNASTEDEIKKTIFDRTRNLGVPIIFDTIGSESSMILGLDLLAKSGTYINLAVHDLRLKFNQMCVSGEKKITSSSNFLIEEYKQALELLGSKKINVEPWFKTIKLSEVPKLFQRIVDENQKDEYFKTIIKND